MTIALQRQNKTLHEKWFIYLITTAYRKTGTRDHSGTLQKPENRDPSGTLQKPENQDPRGTLQKPENQDPKKNGN